MTAIGTPLVLLVDDDVTHLRLTEIMLFNSGCMIATAENARQALEVMATRTPDLIVMDVIMPGLTGTELADRIHSVERLRDIPFIFVTSHATREVKALTKCKSVIAVLEKPLDRNTFRTLVKSALPTPRRQQLAQWGKAGTRIVSKSE